MSLSAYSIVGGAVLVAVAKGSAQLKNHWIHRIIDQETLEQRVSIPANTRVALESALLRDLKIT
jgi:hypothetical protein